MAKQSRSRSGSRRAKSVRATMMSVSWSTVGFSGRRGFAHQAQPLVHRLVDQRLEEAALALEIIIEHRLGHAASSMMSCTEVPA